MKFDAGIEKINESYLTANMPSKGGSSGSSMQGSVQKQHSGSTLTPQSGNQQSGNPNQQTDDGSMLRDLILRASAEEDDGLLDELDNYLTGLGIEDRKIMGNNLMKLHSRWQQNA